MGTTNLVIWDAGLMQIEWSEAEVLTFGGR